MLSSTSLSDGCIFFQDYCNEIEDIQKYGHTLHSSYLTICFSSQSHHQVYEFLHAPVFICCYSYIGQCSHIGTLAFLGVCNAVTYKGVFTCKAKY
jgi:hypothetical protein